MRLEQFISVRYLLKGQRSFFFRVVSLFSLIGIAVGVWALIVMLSVMDGFQNEIKTKVIDNNSHLIVASRFRNYFPDYETITRKLKRMPEVKQIEPFFQGQVLLRKGEEISGLMLRGIVPSFEQKPHRLSSYITAGIDGKKELDFSKWGDEIIISESLALKLKVRLGNYVDVISPAGGGFKVEGFAPRKIRFRVVAFYSTGYGPIDNTQVFTSLSRAQALFDMGDVVWAVGVRGDDPFRADRLKRRIREVLPMRYHILTWSEQQKSFFNALRMEKLIIRILLTLIVVIAALNIISTQIMMIMEKKKDIGILLAMGLSRRRIVAVFLLNGLYIGLSGTALGVAVGMLSVKFLNPILRFIEQSINTGIRFVLKGVALVSGQEIPFNPVGLYENSVYGLLNIPVDYSWFNVGVTGGIAVLLCLLASVYPAARAAKLDPIEAINDR